MNKQLIENILKESKDFDFSIQSLVVPETKKHFSAYFAKKATGLCEEKAISDESLFRDYSRLGDRKVEFEKVRNPFTVSKYTVGNYEKTWYYKNPDKEIQGPYNSHEMDGYFKSNLIEKFTKLSINLVEFFRFDHFIQIVYPLPRNKSKPYKKIAFANNFSNVDNEITKTQNITINSTTKDPKVTPFKRTPFKTLPKEMQSVESFNSNQNSNSFKWNTTWSTQKKHDQSDNVKLVKETFLVKSQTKNRQKHLPNSSKAHYKIEMNDIIGNYTAIKKDADQRQYIDLSKKIDFRKTVVVEKKEEKDDFDLNFDNFEVTKKD